MRIAVIGVGLIGGSVALAAKARLDAEVSGYDPKAAALVAALKLGVIDRAAPTLADAVEGADAVFVAAPVSALPEVVTCVLQKTAPGCVVTDVGSTKRMLVDAHADERFVGGHPLAGAETSGVEHARADLFDGAAWYLTPAGGTSGVLLERLYRILHAFGAQPSAIDAGTHDTILATVSHLPHVLANVLVSQAANALEEGHERIPATGPSFRDATRVAGASSAIWPDIYVANSDAIARQISATMARLGDVRDALLARNREWLTGWNEAAAVDRRRLLESQLAGGELVELRASLPNRPGVIAEVALQLGAAGINIADMALYPAADMRDGVVALWIAGDEPADRAEGVVRELGFPVARA
jgi:prephenate dehydrogenase